MDSVSLSGKPDDVDEEGEGDAKGVADEDAEEEGLPFAVEGDAANFEEDRLDAPDEEDGEEGELGGPGGGDGEADGVERPPGESVVQEGEEGHNGGTQEEDDEALPTRVEGGSHLGDGEAVGEGAGAGEGPGVEVEGAGFVAQVDG